MSISMLQIHKNDVECQYLDCVPCIATFIGLASKLLSQAARTCSWWLLLYLLLCLLFKTRSDTGCEYVHGVVHILYNLLNVSCIQE